MNLGRCVKHDLFKKRFLILTSIDLIDLIYLVQQRMKLIKTKKLIVAGRLLKNVN